MGVDSPNCVGTQSRAVFLSYASQDTEAAFRMRDALRAGGIEVWLDQSELRGGDAWDRQIRERIHDCRLFIALISAHTEARDEGYFRREWKLAVDRTHDMLEKKAFLLPVAIDATPERGAAVPDKFHEVQWTRLSGGEAPPEFVARIKRLLSPESPTTAGLPAGAASGSAPIPLTRDRPWLSRHALSVAVAVLALAALAYLLVNKLWISKSAAPPPVSNAASPSGAPPGAFTPPPHSIAVLPFVNLSGDKDQEYFSDGLTEELLNALSQINDLQVAARTSSFSFREHPDIVTVAHKLNVAAVLEGSVRRSGHTVRVTAQLISAVTGFHLWSKTYDRDLGDVLKLQTEIATSVAETLKVTLLGNIAQKIELGGTRNPAALDAYLRATNAHFTLSYRTYESPVALAAYSEAVRLDPKFALALAGRSIALNQYAKSITGQAMYDSIDKALIDARQAIALAPELAEGHLALAFLFERSLDFAQATTEYNRALALAPGNARVLRDYGYFAVYMGRTDEGLAATRRAAVLDPLNPGGLTGLGYTLVYARRYDEALTAFQSVISLSPDYRVGYAGRGFVYYALGDLQSARSSCETSPEESRQFCLAMVYDKLGRHKDAESALAKFKASRGDAAAYEYAQIYAQLGNSSKALEWLESALRLRDDNLEFLKTDPLMDPLRKEPRFQAVMRELKFPD